MADEPMTVDQEVNGEEVSDPKVNGVESKEVKLDAKETVSEELAAVQESSNSDEAGNSLRLNYDEGSEEQIKNSSNDDISNTVGAEQNGNDEEIENIPETPVTNKGRKRKASSDDEADLIGFEPPSEPSPLIKSRVDKLEKDIREAELESQKWRSGRPPSAKRPHLASPAHSIEIPSRPSSGLSLRSESDLIGGNGSDPNSSAANSPNPFPKGRKSTVDLTSQLFRVPLDQGWKRELVYRASQDNVQRRQGDVYYYTPQGKKLRSSREVSEHLVGTGLTIDNFTFFKEALTTPHQNESTRTAKAVRGHAESPVPVVEKPVVGLLREGKRTPKPKGPKGASPERGVVASSPKHNAQFKVKSLGSRLSNQNSPASAAPKAAAKETPKATGKKVAAATPAKKTTPMYVMQSQSVVESSLSRFPPPLAKYGMQPGAMSPKSGRELCSVHCPLAAGQIPSLQCGVCLCLYHEACANQQGPMTNFICKSCQLAESSALTPPPLTHVSAMKPALKSAQSLPAPPVLQRAPKDSPARIPQPLLVPVFKRLPAPKSIKTVPKLVPVSKSDLTNFNEFRPIQPKKKGIVGSVTTWLPPSSSIRLANKSSAKPPTPVAEIITNFPQTIAIVNGKKYIVVPKHNVLNVSSQFPGNGSNPTPKQAENAPKIMNVDSGMTASSPSPVASKTPKKEADSEINTSLDTSVEEETSSEIHDLSQEDEESDSRAELEEVIGDMTGPTHKAAAESPVEKRKGKLPATPKAVPSPKTAAKSPKVAKAAANGTPGKRGRSSRGAVGSESAEAEPSIFPLNNAASFGSLMQIFSYLNKRELAAAARVCRTWRDVAYTPSLWRTVRMKNSQVTDWQGLAAALKRQGTRHLDLRKMLLPPDDTTHTWDQFIKHISTVDTLLRLEMCRCPAEVVERVCAGLPQLQSLWACSVRDSKLDPTPLASLTNLTELRIKGMTGLQLTSDLKCFENLKNLKHLSLTSVKELEKHAFRHLGALKSLEQLELGDCTFSGEEGAELLAPLERLTKLRLERTPWEGASRLMAPSPGEGATRLVAAVARLPRLTALELINLDIKAGFEDALGQCSNLKRLLVIPMYVSQSATTNRCVLEGVLRLRASLTHLVWGVTIELLRVTELFIDQCDRPADGSTGSTGPKKPHKKSNMGDCIPVLKPVPGMAVAEETASPAPERGPAQVEILPLPALQRLLAAELPDTRLKILRIPFHATTRQALVDLD